MRKSYLFVLCILIACSDSEDEVPPQSDCRLLDMVAHASQTVSTEYSYNDKNQIVGQTRVRAGVQDFSYIISYGTDGKVSEVDIGNSVIEYAYSADGKLESQTFRAEANDLATEVRSHTWTSNTLKVVYKKTTEQHPYATMDYEFVGENIAHTLYQAYADFESNVLSFKEEVTYSDFDTGISPLYLALLKRPGYGVQSKNNPVKSISVTTSYIGGVGQAPQTTSVTYTYTYNASKAATSFITDIEGGDSYLTEVTYDQCP